MLPSGASSQARQARVFEPASALALRRMDVSQWREYNRRQTAAYEDECDALTVERDTSRAESSANNGKIAVLEHKVTTMEIKITALERKNTELERDVRELGADLDARDNVTTPSWVKSSQEDREAQAKITAFELALAKTEAELKVARSASPKMTIEAEDHRANLARFPTSSTSVRNPFVPTHGGSTAVQGFSSGLFGPPIVPQPDNAGSQLPGSLTAPTPNRQSSPFPKSDRIPSSRGGQVNLRSSRGRGGPSRGRVSSFRPSQRDNTGLFRDESKSDFEDQGSQHKLQHQKIHEISTANRSPPSDNPDDKGVVESGSIPDVKEVEKAEVPTEPPTRQPSPLSGKPSPDPTTPTGAVVTPSARTQHHDDDLITYSDDEEEWILERNKAEVEQLSQPATGLPTSLDQDQPASNTQSKDAVDLDSFGSKSEIPAPSDPNQQPQLEPSAQVANLFDSGRKRKQDKSSAVDSSDSESRPAGQTKQRRKA
ncbi:MAG: hypothetical protein Q9169_005102 [Polycauliona sp. 2 TL-2023]